MPEPKFKTLKDGRKIIKDLQFRLDQEKSDHRKTDTELDTLKGRIMDQIHERIDKIILAFELPTTHEEYRHGSHYTERVPLVKKIESAIEWGVRQRTEIVKLESWKEAMTVIMREAGILPPKEKLKNCPGCNQSWPAEVEPNE